MSQISYLRNNISFYHGGSEPILLQNIEAKHSRHRLRIPMYRNRSDSFISLDVRFYTRSASRKQDGSNTMKNKKLLFLCK